MKILQLVHERFAIGEEQDINVNEWTGENDNALEPFASQSSNLMPTHNIFEPQWDAAKQLMQRACCALLGNSSMALIHGQFEQEMRKLSSTYDDVYVHLLLPPSKVLFEQTRVRIQQEHEIAEFLQCETAKEYIHCTSKSQQQPKHPLIWALERESPRVLHVILDDEAHWGIQPRKNRDEITHSRIVRDNENMLVVQLSATPYNLLTRRSPVPNAYVVTEHLLRQGQRKLLRNLGDLGVEK